MPIDLNADIGERPGTDGLQSDFEIVRWVTSVNIACGAHAGDADTMAAAVETALRLRAAIGAHPGVPDRANFGRLAISLSADQAYETVRSQVSALDAITRSSGGRLHHVKPHGALYWMAESDPAIAGAIVTAVHDHRPDLIVYALSGGGLARAALVTGVRVLREVFADRAYLRDGTLVPRSQPGALIDDPSIGVKRIIGLIKSGTIDAIDGTAIGLGVDTVCVHGDGPRAADHARTLRKALDDAGISAEAPRP